MSEQLILYSREISALNESVKSAHKRIDENDRITDGIHKLAANMEALTLQVKLLTERMDSSISRIESGQKSQGERIGKLEGEPADKWKNLASQAIGLVAAAVMGVIISKFT